MPRYEEFEPVQRPEDFDEAAYLTKKINDVKRAYVKRLEYIDSLNNATMQKICLFSLIDSLAQEWGRYSKGNNKNTFCNFIHTFQNLYSYLDYIEPVTLFYRVENTIGGTAQSTEVPADPFGILEEMEIDEAFPITRLINSDYVQKVQNYVHNIFEQNREEKLLKDHTILSLLYQLRNKATHELNDIGAENFFEKEIGLQEPYYRMIENIDLANGRRYQQVELVIPVIFLRNVFINCLDNFLKFCKENNRLPFINEYGRTVLWLTWYDSFA